MGDETSAALAFSGHDDVGGRGSSNRFSAPLHLRRRALVIVIAYAAGAAAWIVLSDRILGQLRNDPDSLVQVGLIKGLAFVAATSTLLYWLMRRATTTIEHAFAAAAEAEDAREAQRAAEATLAQEQRLARDMIDAMPGIFYLYNREGRFLRWNRNFEKVSGYAAPELAAMHPLDFFADDDRHAIRGRIDEVFEHGEASVQADLLDKHGGRTPYFFTGRRIELDGEPCLLGVGIDVTLRKRAEQALRRSEERYRSTLDNILEGCQLFDFDLRYVYLNEAAAVHNRRPNSELLGQRMRDMWPGIEATPVYSMISRCLNDRVALHEETAFTFPDGSTGWFDVRAQAVPEGVFVLSIDISETKAAERALRELNQSLERKVAERTRDLAAAKLRAEAADQLKSAFLATMSHELRTPLNSIIGFTGIILQELAGPLTPEQTKQLGMVRRSAHHLLALINDVLDISKIEAGKLELSCAAFDLRSSVEQVAQSARVLADKKGLTMSVSIPADLPPMHNDRRRVEQVLLNLLNNAVKFTDRGSIALTVERIDRHGAGAVRLRVTDTGIGIPPDGLAKLFQPFHQLDSGLQRQHEGTGLGLAICSRLTEMLGGTISAESEWGVGSVFSVDLPLNWEPPS